MRALCLIRKEPVYRREAFEKGLQRVGFKLFDRPFEPSDSSDWLVIWNRKRGFDEEQADRWEAKGGTVIVAENGYLAQTEKTHYAISVHGHNGSGWFPVGDEDRFTPLGFELKNLRSIVHPGIQIVVRAQRGIGSALMASPQRWAESTAALLRPKFKVTIAPHPGDKNKAAIDTAAIKKMGLAVIWSSALGVRALADGIPVWFDAPHWICEDAATRFRNRDSLPGYVDHWYTNRHKAMHRMSHGQWHFDEIATGEPFARIIANRSTASWP